MRSRIGPVGTLMANHHLPCDAGAAQTLIADRSRPEYHLHHHVAGRRQLSDIPEVSRGSKLDRPHRGG
jgi:hypothetical protein